MLQVDLKNKTFGWWIGVSCVGLILIVKGQPVLSEKALCVPYFTYSLNFSVCLFSETKTIRISDIPSVFLVKRNNIAG